MELIKRLLHTVVQNPAFSTFVALLERIDSERPNLLRVLTYHRVDEPDAHPELSPTLNSATPQGFAQQMAYLASQCRVVSMAEVLRFYARGESLPPRAVLVTFDDAYCDFQEYAWPILKRLQLPVTLFVPTAFPDHLERTFWWDRLYQAVNSTAERSLDAPSGQLPLTTAHERSRAFRQLRTVVKSLPHEEAMVWVDEVCYRLGSSGGKHPVLGWDALRRLAREGVTLGAHSQTHPMMNRIPVEAMRAEALGALRDLEREIGIVLPVFAYPSGGFNEAVVQALREAGIRLAFTTVRGINMLPAADPLRLRRINIGRRASLAAMRAQLLPAMRHFNRWQPLSGV